MNCLAFPQLDYLDLKEALMDSAVIYILILFTIQNVLLRGYQDILGSVANKKFLWPADRCRLLSLESLYLKPGPFISSSA